MKTEHYEAIQRAKLLNVAPSELAHELTVRDMVEAALFEIKNIHAPWSKLNEGSQQEVIDRLNKAAEESVLRAISIISSRSVDTIPLTVTDAKLKVKGITITGVIDPQDPNRKALIDVAGKLCLLVLAPHDYAEALDSNQPDRDQPDLPLHVRDLTGSLFDRRPADTDEADSDYPLGSAAELAERTGADLDKEFGEFTYDEAAQLIVVKSANGRFEAAWVQSRLAIDSDKATTLLLRLLDNGVIQLESEGATALEHSYYVIATLEDVT